MMLPEHKEAIKQHSHVKGEYKKPELCEERIEEIMLTIREAFEQQADISVEFYQKQGNRKVQGKVAKFDQFGKKIRIDFNMGYEWIDLAKIVSAT
ncbi:YolD-like family protein [Paenibacillus sp. NAIST15-1]|uniref:YolD-like family protein n=1 Tax=Paenibacillus sp. NAIST15-1 TaxID=1605994 RepID=UPI000868646C|nr:YolD-like family protein [Paenibacillus sp. NAIST15-1]GAV11409.1 YolD-like protein [Paenibacillus sp. NAIST15-1]